jgi:hypothetical protein
MQDDQHRSLKQPLVRPSQACVGRADAGAEGFELAPGQLPRPDLAGTRRFAWSSLGLDISLTECVSGSRSRADPSRRATRHLCCESRTRRHTRHGRRG